MKPYPFQRHDLDVLARNNYTALANIEPGGGKTPLGAFAIKESGASKTLIIAPDQTHKSAWVPTVGEVTGEEPRVIGGTGDAKKAALRDYELGFPGVYLATPQFFTSADISGWTGDLCIVDEGHLLNNPGAKGQRKLSGFTPKESRESLASRFDGRLFLSGTAYRNSFERAWATMRFLWPELYRRDEVAYDNFHVWQADRMDYEHVVTGVTWEKTTEEVYKRRDPEKVWGKYIDGVPHLGTPTRVKKYLNESEPGLLLSQMPCAITHFRRKECCKFHPKGFLPTDAPQEIHITVPLIPAQKKAIKELEDHMMTWLDSQPLQVELSLTQKQRIRQMTLGVPTLTEIPATEDAPERIAVSFDPDCASPVAERMIEEALELDEDNIIVFMESQSYAAALTEKFNRAGIPAFEYSGQTKKTRDKDLAKFGTDYRVAVVVLAAGGTGLDGLQRVSKTEFWPERSVDETNNIQGEARADRLGGIGQVQRYFFHDDLGYSEGRMGAQLTKRLALAKTLQKR